MKLVSVQRPTLDSVSNTGDTYYISDKNTPPIYYGYETYSNSGWDNVTICLRCKMVGLYEDCHPVQPCKFCGGKIKDRFGAGIWVPEKVSKIQLTFPPKWKLWERPKFKVTREPGHWKVLLNT